MGDSRKVIEYRIIGRVDGRWTVQAFDAKGNKLGTTVMVNTPNEAWKVWRLLSGYSDEEPTQEIEVA